MKVSWLLGSLSILLAITSCSTSIERSSISSPAYFWEQSNGLCGFTRAVDAQGNLWDDNGCEDGRATFRKIGQLDSASLRQLETAFADLPSPTDVECTMNYPPHTFTKRLSADSSTTWEVCAAGDGNNEFYETTGLEQPYLTIAQLFIP